MTIQVEFWHLVGLAISLVGGWFTLARLFFGQVDKRLDERFDAQERDRRLQYEAINTTLAQAMRDNKGYGERLARLEQDVLRMPSHDDIAQLHEKINAVSGGIHAVSGKIDGIEANLRQVIGRLIDKGMRFRETDHD